MLGALWFRPPKPWIISPQTFAIHNHQIQQNLKKTSDQITAAAATSNGCAALIWRVTVPAAAGGGDWRSDYLRPSSIQKGDGSWNVAGDARPARWLHHLDLTYLLFGVCLCLAPIDWNDVVTSENHNNNNNNIVDHSQGDSSTYRVTGCEKWSKRNYQSETRLRVLADGRCLFRAIAHGACLQSGEEVPDENRQRELADDLRAKVVEELLKRRKEIEWFIEEDFDSYVKRIQQPYVWGGEPELLMASHVLEKFISVFTKDKSTGNLVNIATYGEEYKNDNPINVLFHRYGHYELLETSLS